MANVYPPLSASTAVPDSHLSELAQIGVSNGRTYKIYEPAERIGFVRPEEIGASAPNFTSLAGKKVSMGAPPGDRSCGVISQMQKVVFQAQAQAQAQAQDIEEMDPLQFLGVPAAHVERFSVQDERQEGDISVDAVEKGRGEPIGALADFALPETRMENAAREYAESALLEDPEFLAMVQENPQSEALHQILRQNRITKLAGDDWNIKMLPSGDVYILGSSEAQNRILQKPEHYMTREHADALRNAAAKHKLFCPTSQQQKIIQEKSGMYRQQYMHELNQRLLEELEGEGEELARKQEKLSVQSALSYKSPGMQGVKFSEKHPKASFGFEETMRESLLRANKKTDDKQREKAREKKKAVEADIQNWDIQLEKRKRSFKKNVEKRIDEEKNETYQQEKKTALQIRPPRD